MAAFQATYPDIRVEVTIDDNLTDIVTDRYDTGIRLGATVKGKGSRTCSRSKSPATSPVGG